ncbi:MAG: phosphatase PAP2 family protein [Desulfovibrionales bacterium]|nr:phosphatase PAP2 family protein [Desulfovibrionales bacterium]
MFFLTPDWEMTLFTWINQHWRCALFDRVMPLLSETAFLWILALAAAALVIFRHRVPATAVLGLCLTIAASDLTCSVIKESTGRIRPYHSIPGTWYVDSGQWVQRPADAPPPRKEGSSYPSAHAANAAAATFVLFRMVRIKSIWLMPILIGYSRIYLGKHFPLDVLGGWAIGLAVSCALLPLYPGVWNRLFSRWMR